MLYVNAKANDDVEVFLKNEEYVYNDVFSRKIVDIDELTKIVIPTYNAVVNCWDGLQKELTCAINSLNYNPVFGTNEYMYRIDKLQDISDLLHRMARLINEFDYWRIDVDICNESIWNVETQDYIFLDEGGKQAIFDCHLV